jgi:hypothetical protein
MKQWMTVAIAFGIMAAGADPIIMAFAQAANTGAAEILLEGGTSGSVKFPHQRHQQKLTDCMICHSAFPQKSGAIEELKSQGRLAKKQIMNEQCTKCHKEKKQAGEPSGPTTCTTCHVKQ